MPLPRSRANWSELLDLSVDPAGGPPIFQQVYLALRGAILAGTLRPGAKLPSSRQLAQRLALSRTSVIAAYEQLLAEGYVASRAGSGTYVSADLQTQAQPAARVRRPARSPAVRRVRLSAAGARYEALGRDLSIAPAVPFTAGCCSVDAKTIGAWRRVTAARARVFEQTSLAYADPAGETALRREAAAYLRASRGVQCDDDQVIVLSGAQQAIDLSIRVLLNAGDGAWVEDPGYVPTREALLSAGVACVPVPVDAHGLDVAAGIACAPRARAVYITPSHQYPTGAAMSMARRQELLAWAAKTGAWIVEDDYDSEFRYAGRPLAALQGLDPAGSVIYIATLSKVLFPGLRLGFAVVPRSLIDAFRGARYLADRSPPAFLQAIAADFMQQGFLTSHIRRMRQRYRQARDVLVACLERHLGDIADVEVPECGMQLLLRFRAPVSDIAVAEAARTAGIVVKPVSPHYMAAPVRQGLVLGLSGFDDRQLKAAGTRLAAIVRSELACAERGTARPAPGPGQSGMLRR
ncbi:MAG: PLP-dependent aminotransferase family protein [Hyphomicrobiaceae bacterium]|nr:PLP-dependent aminotransferase family protein [Hyphomicrobiaceae bacterium]